MNGDTRNQLKDLYDEHVDALYRYAYFKLQSNEEEAIDIVQEAFYKLGVEFSKGKSIENPKSYLYRMIGNKIIDFYRKNTPLSLEEQLENSGDIIASDTSVEDIAYAKLEVEKVYRILAGLSEDDKDIFLLRYVEELTPQEIAERYDLDVNSLTVKLHRLKEKVKSHFENI